MLGQRRRNLPHEFQESSKMRFFCTRFFRQVAVLAALALGTTLAPAQTVSSGQARLAPASPARTGEPLDINTATAAQLKALPGVGNAYADRIIKGRPYTAKNQLVSRGVLPQDAYLKIQGMIIARRPAK
jgi:DNA uptake protein ComE-like DNA-binding protein